MADSLEAMASDRPYRNALSYEEILDEISRNTGTQFDPLVVAALHKVLAREGKQFVVNSALLLERQETTAVIQASRRP